MLEKTNLEKIERVNYLIDFYDQLLTKKQRSVVDLYYKENFSLGEIGDQLNISRQAVHDILSRSIQALEQWEAKLNLYETYIQRGKEGQKILALLENDSLTPAEIKEVKAFINMIL